MQTIRLYQTAKKAITVFDFMEKACHKAEENFYSKKLSYFMEQNLTAEDTWIINNSQEWKITPIWLIVLME